jgi:hypothetical protein
VGDDVALEKRLLSPFLASMPKMRRTRKIKRVSLRVFHSLHKKSASLSIGRDSAEELE